MRFPRNSIVVKKGIEEAFSLLVSPDLYAPVLKREYRVKMEFEKRAPMEVGRKVTMVMPSEVGEIVAHLELSDVLPPVSFRYDVASVNKKKKNKEEPIPIFIFVDKISLDVKFTDAKDGTRVVFTTCVNGLSGLLTKAFVYAFFGVPSWFSNRKYLQRIRKAVNDHEQ